MTTYAREESGMISGKVLSPDGEPVVYATVYLKGTSFSCSTNEKGLYHLRAPGVSILSFFRLSVSKEKRSESV